MSRPKPSILLDITDKKTFKSEQILESEGIWAVFYKGKPINLRTLSLIGGGGSPKYKKVSFSNPGHAKNLAKKLNIKYDCRDFSVHLLKTGNRIE